MSLPNCSRPLTKACISKTLGVEGGTLRTRIGQNPMILIDHGFLLVRVAAPHRFDEDNTTVLGRLAPSKSLTRCDHEASR